MNRDSEESHLDGVVFVFLVLIPNRYDYWLDVITLDVITLDVVILDVVILDKSTMSVHYRMLPPFR